MFEKILGILVKKINAEYNFCQTYQFIITLYRTFLVKTDQMQNTESIGFDSCTEVPFSKQLTKSV